MKLLITGAGGQLSNEWEKYAKEKSLEYVALGIEELDISNSEQVSDSLNTHSPDVIINCAAYTLVDKAEEEAKIADLINHEAVKDLATQCKRQGIKLVHYSTDYVFPGKKEDQVRFPNGYPEQYKTGPVNVYGATKRDGEKAIIDSGCDHLILRISWLCGAYGNNFVKTMMRLGTQRDELMVVNDQFGSPTFADNVVDWSYKLLQKEVLGTIHLSSSGITNWYEFSTSIFELTKISVKVTPVDSTSYKTIARRPSYSKLDTTKAEQLLGEPMIHWKEGLKNLIKELTT
ncbi:MAG: dTDP-4-dehydrorhamnose reductase [Balneolales bacterium]|nr:dTDP-4-dehydrorhamnose reductase [Balneolales bacterium]